jgi:radical SAM superfamily enzyme YgiQ (UPF0313 family)
MIVPTPAGLDCIIVGYHDLNFDEVIRSSYTLRSRSGSYESLRNNSVPFGDRRVDYMQLLNSAMEAAHGENPGFHVANMPSLGAWYLASYLKKSGYQTEVINFFGGAQARLRELLLLEPRAVAITTTFYVEPGPIKEIVRFIREINTKVRIVIGGPYVFNLCEQTDGYSELLSEVLSDIGADLVVYDSQGELTLARILGFLRGERSANEITVAPASKRSRSNSLAKLGSASDPVLTDDLHNIPNLIFFESGAMVRTPRQVESNDMNIFSEDWSAVAEQNFVPTVVTRTARSCAFSCSFCRYPIVAGPLNLKSLDTIEKQLDLFQERGVRNLVIIDDTFNVPLPRFKDICRLFIRKRYDFQWFSYFRAANADASCFDLMAESRCGGVFLGIESGDQTILDNMHKSSRVDKYVTAIRKLNERGIITFASLIVGFPGETAETVRNTMRFLEEAEPLYYRAELYYHGTNTPIHDRRAEFGIKSAGYSWKHATMSWQEACQHIGALYRSIRGSLILPVYNFDFWCIPYLLGRGLTKAQIHEFVKGANTLLIDELNGGKRNAKNELARLARALQQGGGQCATAAGALREHPYH